MAVIIQVGGPEDLPPPPPRFPTCGDWDNPDPESEPEEALAAGKAYTFDTKEENSAGCVAMLSIEVVALCYVVNFYWS